MTDPAALSGSDLSGIDWEDAFANGVHIPGGDAYPARWTKRAAGFRENAHAQVDLPYGEGPRDVLDLFLPDGTPRGLAIFIHGGFWKAFDKSNWSHLAAGPLARGWAVVMPSYTLAPDARISEITAQVGCAIAHAADLTDGPIAVAGHSAGGHLATRMVCEDAPLPDSVAERINSVLSISGVHDLRPLQLHSMNEDLRLDPEEAIAESPVLNRARPGLSITAWVGARERPEFLRQSALLAEAWRAPLVVEPERHHFDVIEGLADPDHPMTHALLKEDADP